MNFTCDKSALLNACRIVESVISPRATMPVYRQIKAVATSNRLTLMGTDLEVGVRVDLASPAINEHGEAILPVSKLTQIMREVPDDTIRVETNKTRTLVTTFAGEFEMSAEDPSTFSDVATFEDGTRFTEISAGELLPMIARTAFAAATDEGKYAMRGVLFNSAADCKRMVASFQRLSTGEQPYLKATETSLGTE